MRPEWITFQTGVWEKEINVRDFIQKNYTPYDGDDAFLAGPTQNTIDYGLRLWILLSRKEKPAAYWIWILRLSPPSPPMAPDI